VNREDKLGKACVSQNNEY